MIFILIFASYLSSFNNKKQQRSYIVQAIIMSTFNDVSVVRHGWQYGIIGSILYVGAKDKEIRNYSKKKCTVIQTTQRSAVELKAPRSRTTRLHTMSLRQVDVVLILLTISLTAFRQQMRFGKLLKYLFLNRLSEWQSFIS